MITFSQLGKYGRLGNQLFQYAALKSLGLKNNYEVKIPNPKTMIWHGQECLLDNFNLECDYLEDGYLQKIELTLKEEFIKEADEFLKKLKKDNENKEIVSIHLRRGDLTDGTTTPTNNYYDKDGKISKDSICGSYLDKAMKYFNNDKYIFLLFTGGSREGDDNEKDVSWLMENLKGANLFYSGVKTTLQDFALIQRCDHNIMSHSSSFSWWAAYLNNNPNKIVIAPKDYTMIPDEWAREGFYPKNFTLI